MVTPMPLSHRTPLRAWTDAALSFLYPEVCSLCGNERATCREGFVGETCRAQVRFIVPPFCDRCGLPFEGDITTEFECTNCREMDLHFSRARSAVAARGPVLEAIHRFKYKKELWFETFLGELLTRAASEPVRGGKWDALVPVPLFSVKQRSCSSESSLRRARHG
jgi:predicted amidophosphoribosyltransferase